MNIARIKILVLLIVLVISLLFVANIVLIPKKNNEKQAKPSILMPLKGSSNLFDEIIED